MSILCEYGSRIAVRRRRSMAFEIGSRQDDIMALWRFGHSELRLDGS